MTWKSTVAVSGLTVVATWLGVISSPPAGVPQPRTVAAAQPAVSSSAVARTFDIQREAARLRVRLREDTAYREPGRNPFRFAGRRRAAAPPVELPPIQVAPPQPVGPPPPPFTLAGIVTDRPAAGAVQGASRSAVLSTPVGVLIVKEGDAIGSAYRVERISEENVEIRRLADEAAIVLPLKP
jgi:hypothetical protein